MRNGVVRTVKLWTSRMRDKQDQNYRSVCQTLRDSGVDSVAKAEACRRTMLNNARTYTLLALAVLIVFLLLLPQSAAISISVFGCIALWIWVSTASGRKHIVRFIEEELGGRTD